MHRRGVKEEQEAREAKAVKAALIIAMMTMTNTVVSTHEYAAVVRRRKDPKEATMKIVGPFVLNIAIQTIKHLAQRAAKAEDQKDPKDRRATIPTIPTTLHHHIKSLRVTTTLFTTLANASRRPP